MLKAQIFSPQGRRPHNVLIDWGWKPEAMTFKAKAYMNNKLFNYGISETDSLSCRVPLRIEQPQVEVVEQRKSQ
jgi:hypothetical protein